MNKLISIKEKNRRKKVTLKLYTTIFFVYINKLVSMKEKNRRKKSH